MGKSQLKCMTEGSPMKLLVMFILPMLLGLVFQQFYTMVDTVVVGKYLGVNALAGVGSSGAVNFLILGFCTGLCTGFSVPLAQKFGAEDFEGMRRLLGNMVWLTLAIAAIFTTATVLLCRQLLTLMSTPEETFAYAYHYIVIIFMGIPAIMLYNLVSGILRALGDSRTPLYFLIFSSIVNVVLDVVLIFYARMGVAGAAVATVISQLLSGLLCLLYMARHYPLLHISREDFKPRVWESRRLLAMGVPMGLQFSITAIGCALLQFSVNRMGAAAMAAFTAADRIICMFGSATDALGTAAATFVGQNVGAGKLDRVRRGTRAGLMLGLGYCAVVLILNLIWGNNFLMIFLREDDPNLQHILHMAHSLLIATVSGMITLMVVNLFRCTVQGMGFSGLAILSGALEMIGRGVTAAYAIASLDFFAICITHVLAWGLADFYIVPIYFYCLSRLRRQYPAAGIPEAPSPKETV